MTMSQDAWIDPGMVPGCFPGHPDSISPCVRVHFPQCSWSYWDFYVCRIPTSSHNQGPGPRMPGSTQVLYQDACQVILIRFRLVFMLRSCCVHCVHVLSVPYKQAELLFVLHRLATTFKVNLALWRLTEWVIRRFKGSSFCSLEGAANRKENKYSYVKVDVQLPPSKISRSQHNIYAIGQANSAPCMPIVYKQLIMHCAA